MLPNNLLPPAQLQQQKDSQIVHTEGIVKSTNKGFGFLEVGTKKSYFIPPLFMKRVMHGDKVSAILYHDKGREIAEPKTLIEPYLSRFLGLVHIKDNIFTIIPDNPMIKEVIPARPLYGISQTFNTGDWVIAEMCCHPLKGDNQFYAEITTLITTNDDHFAHWWITLARYNLERDAPEVSEKLTIEDTGVVREDLTGLDFVTIDNASTKDIDDALHVVSMPNDTYILTIAISDPTAWVPAGSKLDIIARDRAFTHYLPGFSIPMLPSILSEDLCSLRAHEYRPALVCQVTIKKDGTIANDTHFLTAWIESKAKLDYDNVSDWLEKSGKWQPANDAIARQINLLYHVYKTRIAWRQQYALVFKDRPYYRFILDDIGNVKHIKCEQRRIANRIIEEAMIVANICAARTLRDDLGFGLYNIHSGFDTTLIKQLIKLLQSQHITADATQLLTQEGFCALHRKLDAVSNSYLDSRIRRFHTFSELSIKPGPHYGLGLDVYATWTSPIRKYSDMINHRLLKALISASEATCPSEDILLHLIERRRQNRVAEKEINNWLYACFLKNKAGSDICYSAEIIDILRRGIRVRLVDIGAVAFIPASYIHNVRNELVCSQDVGIVQVNGKEHLRQGEIIKVMITEVSMTKRSIIARISQ